MLVVIGPGTFIDDALAFTARPASSTRPSHRGGPCPRQRPTSGCWSQALQCGVREVVALGLGAQPGASHTASRAVTAWYRRLCWARPPHRRRPAARPARRARIIAWCSRRRAGSVQDRQIATNIGVVLAERQQSSCVYVVDLDLAAGDIAISLLLNPVRTLADAVPMAGNLDAAGAASLLTPLPAEPAHAAGAGDPRRRGQGECRPGQRAASVLRAQHVQTMSW